MIHYTCDRCGQIMLNNERIAMAGLRGRDCLAKELCSKCINEFHQRFMANHEFTALDRIEAKGEEHERDTTGSGTTTEG